MHIVLQILQLIVALGILNVWLLRVNQQSAYRGASAVTLKDEFMAYGLPEWFYYFVGLLKIISAVLLIIGIWIPELVLPAASVIAVLMLGAIAMHIKVGDVWLKSVPAIIMAVLALLLCWGYWR